MKNREPHNQYTSERRSAPLIVVVTILAYFVLYAPQPLLPLFQRQFGVSPAQIALLTTATMLPLSIAPLLYGSLLTYVAPAKILRISLAVLGVSELAFAIARTFTLILVLRFVQGVVLPAVLTAITTYAAANAKPGLLRRTMGIYVASTIVGGYLGRLLSSVAASVADWRIFFLILAILLMASAIVPFRPIEQRAKEGPTPPRRDRHRVLRNRSYVTIYAGVFCLFFVFSGILNVLAFRVKDISNNAPEWLTGVMYSGYLLGIVASLGSGTIVKGIGNDRRAIALAFILYIAALIMTGLPNTGVLFGALFLFCGSMFLIHAIATGMVNQIGVAAKSVVNGFYITFYYGGGVLGSFFSGVIYTLFGWGVLLAFCSGVAIVGLLSMVMGPNHRGSESR